MKCALTVISIAIVLCYATGASAGWDPDGNAVAAYPNQQTAVVALPDGAGGAFLAWRDLRDGNQDIYAQRIAPDGTAMWGAGGIPVCTAVNLQWNPKVAPDGAGGMVICWEDERNGGSQNTDVYAQRVNANGNTLWADDGIAVCNANGRQVTIDVHFDGGTYLVAWEDSRSTSPDIYVQRLDTSGASLWTTNGVGAVLLIASDQLKPVVVSDAAGGAIVAWEDNRSGFLEVYAQSINFFGTPAWTTNGVNIDPGHTAADPDMIEDGAGGIVVAYNDDDGDRDIYVRHCDASGTLMWRAPALVMSGNQEFARIISDGAGGSIVTWQDARADVDIYAQRITALGALLWSGNGAQVCTFTDVQTKPAIDSDGAGGAIIAWVDDRNGVDDDVYVQRIRSNGIAQWASNGVPATTAYNNQSFATVVGDGNGGAIVAWTDQRSDVGDIYAQRVEPNYGAWGMPEPTITSALDDPNDQGGDVAVNWKASQRDSYLYPEVTQYTLWRAVDAVTASTMKTVTPSDFASGLDLSTDQPVVRVESTATADYYWELVGTQQAVRAAGYSKLVATRQDSTSIDPAVHYFQVIAHTGDPGVFYVSDAVSGHSVDNLAPAAPLMLTAQRVGNYVLLDWLPGGENEPDFDTYAVYRRSESGVTPDPVFFLSSTLDTTLWDQNVSPDVPYYYIVTAVDIHENQSAPSNVANVTAGPTGAGDTPALTSLQVRANVPNPFGASTELQVGLPEASEVSVDVYDVAGRRVAALSTPSQSAGWHTLRFDGRDAAGRPLPSGVYFYRVNAGGETVTRKLVIQR